MWLNNLKELKCAKGLTVKQIAELTNLPERTVSRIFSGDTENPYMDTLHRIVSVLDGSLDDIFAEGTFVIGTKNLKMLQDELELVVAERDVLASENAVLKEMNTALTAENELLRVQIAHKDEIIALHNYYNKLKTNE